MTDREPEPMLAWEPTPIHAPTPLVDILTNIVWNGRRTALDALDETRLGETAWLAGLDPGLAPQRRAPAPGAAPALRILKNV